MTVEVATEDRAAIRRARFREAVAGLSERLRSTDLLRLLLLPGAVAVVLGFGLMFLAWYGASRTYREVEQIPYLISGGLIGLALTFLGGLLLASALWMTMLQRFREDIEERMSQTREPPPPPAPSRRRARSARTD